MPTIKIQFDDLPESRRDSGETSEQVAGHLAHAIGSMLSAAGIGATVTTEWEAGSEPEHACEHGTYYLDDDDRYRCYLCDARAKIVVP